MKKTVLILLSILSLNAALAFADDKKEINANQFSYKGIGFKATKADLASKGFDCNDNICKRDENDTEIKVIFTSGNVQSIDARTRYSSQIDCASNQQKIKTFMIDKYDLDYVSKDYRFLGILVEVKDVSGSIHTDMGAILVDISCQNDTKINRGYVFARFDLKDISYQNFKNDFKYE